MYKRIFKAPHRKTISAPLKYLIKKHLKVFQESNILDYGCGKGFDILNIKKEFGIEMQGYDEWYGIYPSYTYFDIVYCGYVLNVLYPHSCKFVLQSIKNYLSNKGIAYIAVRRDIPKTGLRNNHGKYLQHYIELPFNIEYERKGRFCIYKMSKYTKISSSV